MFTPSRSRSPVPRTLTPPVRTGRSGLTRRSTQLLILRFGWIVLVIWYEVGEFFGSLSGCRFPDARLKKVSSHTPTHIVLIADPHVPHPRLSHPPDSKPWVNALRQGMEELYMRKSWNIVRRLGRIDAVIFVGDMLDQGRAVMTDQEYDEYHTLFRSIFRLPSSIPMYYVPGNHDIPLGGTGNIFSPQARQRYTKHFSPPNAVLSVANHSIILLDAIGLVEEDYRRYYDEMQFGEWEGIENGVIEFVQTLGKDPPPSPILISHIPLARTEASSCGPKRESHDKITKGAGVGYQNLLGRDTSRFLLETIKPDIVFSGDDHDYCLVQHPNGVPEVTIKSFSSNAGIRRPGFQLLSLVPPQASHPGYDNVPCFLPDQIGVYTHVYLPFGLLTIAYLLLSNIRTAWSRSSIDKRHHHQQFMTEERHRERPVPLTLPSRRSAQHLQSVTITARERHTGSATPMSSCPPSPTHSHHDDLELGGDCGSYGGESNNSSYSTPRMGSSGLLHPIMQPNPRRVALPRLMSASDWASAARAKDMSVLTLVAEQRKPFFASLRVFFRWLWHTRHSVIGKSWWEAVSIAVPAVVVWLLMNALFFRQ